MWRRLGCLLSVLPMSLGRCVPAPGLCRRRQMALWRRAVGREPRLMLFVANLEDGRLPGSASFYHSLLIGPISIQARSRF